MGVPECQGKPDITQLGVLSKIVWAVATVLMLAGTCIMVLEGFSRFFLGVSYFWAEESVRFLMLWAFFLTLGIAGLRQYHIRTELLVAKLPPKVQKATWVLACLLGMLFSWILGYSSIAQVQRYYTIGMLSESNLEIPMWIVFLAMPVGGIAMFLYYAQALWYAIRWADPFGSEITVDSGLDQATMDAMVTKGN